MFQSAAKFPFRQFFLCSYVSTLKEPSPCGCLMWSKQPLLRNVPLTFECFNLLQNSVSDDFFLGSYVAALKKPLCKVVHYFSIQCQPTNPIQSELDADWQKLPIDYQYWWNDKDWDFTQFVSILSQSWKNLPMRRYQPSISCQSNPTKPNGPPSGLSF